MPDQPPQASDWQSADARTVNVGSGGLQADISEGGGSSSLRSPATSDDVENVGRTAKDGLSGLPNDAVSQGKKNRAVWRIPRARTMVTLRRTIQVLV